MTYPAYEPTDRRYVHGEWPITRHRFMANTEQRVLHATAKTGQELRLTYANQTTEIVQQFLYHYDAMYGMQYAFEIPNEVYEGWDGSKDLLGRKQLWQYKDIPRITSQKGLIATLQVTLVVATSQAIRCPDPAAAAAETLAITPRNEVPYTPQYYEDINSSGMRRYEVRSRFVVTSYCFRECANDADRGCTPDQIFEDGSFGADPFIKEARSIRITTNGVWKRTVCDPPAEERPTKLCFLIETQNEAGEWSEWHRAEELEGEEKVINLGRYNPDRYYWYYRLLSVTIDGTPQDLDPGGSPTAYPSPNDPTQCFILDSTKVYKSHWFKAGITHQYAPCNINCSPFVTQTTEETDADTNSNGPVPHTLEKLKSMDWGYNGNCQVGDTSSQWYIKDADGRNISPFRNTNSQLINSSGPSGSFCTIGPDGETLDTGSDPILQYYIEPETGEKIYPVPCEINLPVEPGCPPVTPLPPLPPGPPPGNGEYEPTPDPDPDGNSPDGPDGPNPPPSPGPGPGIQPEPEDPLRDPEDPDCSPDAVGTFVVKTRAHVQLPTRYTCNGIDLYEAAEYEITDYEITFAATDIRVYTSRTEEYVLECAGPFDFQKSALRLYNIYVQGSGCGVPYKQDGEWFAVGVGGGAYIGRQGESTKYYYVTVPKNGSISASTSIVRWGEIVSVTKDGIPFTPQRFPFTPYPDLSPHREPYYDCLCPPEGQTVRQTVEPRAGNNSASRFPDYHPSSRTYELADWNTKRFAGAMTGQSVTIPLTRQSVPSDGKLSLTFANRADNVAEDILRHYHAFTGGFKTFKLSTEIFEDWNSSYKNELRQAGWIYDAPPQVTTSHPGTSTTSVRLALVKYSPFIPGSEPAPEPEPEPPIQIPGSRIQIFIDDSGSMETLENFLRDMVPTTLKKCLLPHYGGDESLYADRVRVIYMSQDLLSSEQCYRAAYWIDEDSSGQSPTTELINIIFQDESSLAYLPDSRDVADWTINSPREIPFEQDINTLRSRVNAYRDPDYAAPSQFNAVFGPGFYNGFIFKVINTEYYKQDSIWFGEFLEAVQKGQGNYTGTYSSKDIPELKYTYDIPIVDDQYYYMNLIIDAINSLGYNVPKCR